MSFVCIERLHVFYRKVHAVRGISFEIPKGATFGFIGPNGAGKTSTIKVLATLKKPSRGHVRIGGLDVARSTQGVRRMIGFVPDAFGVYDDLSVKQYLHFFAAAYKLDRRARDRTVGDVLALTDLDGKLEAPVDSLSRGMKQRLSLARVLLHDPDLLLLDEPASGLDPRARIEMRELLKELERMGKTILISSHILHELSQLCTRVGIIEAGKMVVEGSLDEIYKRIDLLRVVHVQVTDPSDALIAKIEALDGVEGVRREVDRLAVRVREETLSLEDLLEGILAAGARVRMFQPEAMDMETAFMKLTEGRTA